ncbi:hypothetical protein B484DRAFT_459784, partial [Ochromonadaceae sp. CCMP2298]
FGKLTTRRLITVQVIIANPASAHYLVGENDGGFVGLGCVQLDHAVTGTRGDVDVQTHFETYLGQFTAAEYGSMDRWPTLRNLQVTSFGYIVGADLTPRPRSLLRLTGPGVAL